MNDLKRLTFTGVFVVIISGILWHFVYEWTGKNFIVGFFFPVNESTWEHMKLCFFPMLLYSLYMNKKLKIKYPCITSSLLLGILVGTFSIPILFYTYSGMLGFHFLFFDMVTFTASIFLAFLTVYKFSSSHKLACLYYFLILLAGLLFICFLLFTYYSPGIGLFANPVK